MANEPHDGSGSRTTTLGGVLRFERERRLLAIDHVARLAGVQVETIRALERDDHELSPIELDELMHHYQGPDWSIRRALGELTLDLDLGIVSFSNRDSTRVLDDPADRVLARYILLLYTYRSAEIGTKIPVKDIDLMVLRAALNSRKPEVERQIRNLQTDHGSTSVEAERKRLIAVRALALIVVALGVAMLLSGPSRSDESTPADRSTTIEIGEAVSIVRPPPDLPEG